jgi:hypothetical protein
MDDSSLIERITELARSGFSLPDDRVLLKVISILERSRGGGSTGLAGSRHQMGSAGSSYGSQSSFAKRRDDRKGCADRREREKSKMQPSETKLEHLTLNIGGADDARRQKYAALQQKVVHLPVSKREVAVRKLQHQMESAPHADAYADDMTQIGGMAVRRPSMTHDLTRFGALGEMEGKLRSGRPAWYNEGPVHEGALDHGPMRF